MNGKWRKLIQHDLMNLYNSDVMEDEIAEKVKKIIEEFINSSPSDNNDFKKPCPECGGKGYPNVAGNRIYSHECCFCKGTGRAS